MSVTYNFTCYFTLCLLCAYLPCYRGRGGTAGGAERAVAAAGVGVERKIVRESVGGDLTVLARYSSIASPAVDSLVR